MTAVRVTLASSPRDADPSLADFAPGAATIPLAFGDDGVSTLAIPLALSSAPWRVTVPLADGDLVYGLGAGAVGAPVRNGQRLRLMNRDTLFFGIEGATYASFPLVWVRDADGGCCCVVVLTARPLDLEVSARAVTFSLVEVTGAPPPPPPDVVVIDGAPAEIGAELKGLLGATFLPPAWALGFHQSRWSYRTADDVLQVAKDARAVDVPLDVVHLDIHMMEDYRVFTFHPRRFPAPRALHAELAALGVRTMAIIDPGLSTAGKSDARFALEANDGLLTTSTGAPYAGKVWPGETVFPDLGRTDVDDVWARAHAVLLDAGVSGFWNDMNDPVFKVGVEYDPLAEDVRHDRGARHHVERRNLYANAMAKATRQGLTARAPDERQFVLSRSGFLSIQRNAALWTGDNFTSWEQLEESLHMVIHLGLSGVPLSGADIGGFGGRRGKYGIAKLKPPAELFVRWLELGALLPFCRVHSVLYGPRQEPWSFSSSVTRLARHALRRRMRLIGVLSTLCREARETGAPLVRPLWWHDDVAAPTKSYAALAARQFLLGKDILVAPVLRDGARRWEVALPPGRWLDTRDGVVHVAGAGGAVIDVAAPLGSPPLFLRGGAVVPWFAPARSAQETLAMPLTLEVVVPQGEGGGRVVLDDGVRAAGAAVELVARHDPDKGTLDLILDVVDQGFVPSQRTVLLRLPPGFSAAHVTSSAVHGRGPQMLDVRERVLDLAADDGRGGVVSEVEIPLEPCRVLAT